MKHTVTLLKDGRPLTERRPFEDYRDQPDTAERVRLQVQAIPWALPPKKEEADLVQMRPRGAKFDATDMSLTNAVCGRDDSLRTPVGSDRANICLGEFGETVSGSSRTDSASLGVAVSGIIGISAKEQMRWVDTGAHVALVADDHAVRDWAFSGLPRQSVGSAVLSVMPHLPVALPIAGKEPQQAPAVGLWHGALFQLAPKLKVVHGIISHLTALLRRSLVRVGTRAPTRFRPAFSTIPGIPAKGISP